MSVVVIKKEMWVGVAILIPFIELKIAIINGGDSKFHWIVSALFGINVHGENSELDHDLFV